MTCWRSFSIFSSMVFMLLDDDALEFWVCLTLCSIYCPYINLEKLQKFQCFICGQVKSDARRVCQDKPAVAYACSVPFNNCVHSYSLLLRCICVIRLKPFVWSKTTNRGDPPLRKEVFDDLLSFRNGSNEFKV